MLETEKFDFYEFFGILNIKKILKRKKIKK